MAAKKVNRKRRVKKNIEAGIAHIHSTFNNTIIMITDTDVYKRQNQIRTKHVKRDIVVYVTISLVLLSAHA